MTVKQGLRRLIFKKTVILVCIAAILGVSCYLTSDHKNIPDYGNAHLLYTIASICISVAIVVFVAWRMRYFHNLFGKEWTGTVVSVRRDVLRTTRANMSVDDLVMTVKIDGKERNTKLRLPGNKVGKDVYFAGDRIHRLKGTRYPINLTREVEQHICPICARNSCYGDECPDCRVKY